MAKVSWHLVVGVCLLPRLDAIPLLSRLLFSTWKWWFSAPQNEQKWKHFTFTNAFNHCWLNYFGCLYLIWWLASLRTRSTSLPFSSSSLVRVSIVSLREWISWSRSVMRLLREHTSVSRSEMRTRSSCSFKMETENVNIDREKGISQVSQWRWLLQQHMGKLTYKKRCQENRWRQHGYLLVAVLQSFFQLSFDGSVFFNVDLL